MKKLFNSAIVALVIFASVFVSIGPSTAQTLAPLITPYVNESDMASIQQIFNSNPDLNAPDGSLRYVHDGLDIAPTGNLKPFRAACSGRIHWVLAFDDGVNVMVDCNSTYTLEYNFEPQSAGTGQTQLAHIAVVEGQAVLQGDVIGYLYVANAALAHVHFAVLKNWVNSCPEQYFDSAASNSISNLVHVRFPGTDMCHGGDVTPPPLVTPYVNESDMASVNEAFSADGSTSPWGFVHDGIDFLPRGNLKPFRATCSGVVDFVYLLQNNVTSNWQVNLLIVCNPYVLDPNMGGYFSPLAVEYVFEPMSNLQTIGQTQLDNIIVAKGQAVSQGDVIGYLYTSGEGAHVHFGTIPLGSMLTSEAYQIPRTPICPESHFDSAAKTSILNLLHVVWPGAGMCYQTCTETTATGSCNVTAGIAAIEFYKADIGHYFMTASTDEVTVLDNKPEWNWVRTGKTFNIWLSQSIAPDNASPVCRFFGVFANGTVGSHFYTVDAAECDMVKGRLDWGWGYENDAFYAVKPAADGTCSSGTAPIYRAYNNGMSGAPNHRYMATQAEVDTMVSQGWISEGTAFCGAQ